MDAVDSADANANSKPDNTIARVLTVFTNPAEDFVTEHPLSSFDLEQFRQWFNEDGGDPLMYNCYLIAPKDVEFVSGFLNEPIEFDFSRYCYFVESDVSDEEWKRYDAKG